VKSEEGLCCVGYLEKDGQGKRNKCSRKGWVRRRYSVWFFRNPQSERESPLKGMTWQKGLHSLEDFWSFFYYLHPASDTFFRANPHS